MNRINIDFNQTAGDIRPLHGMCCAPYATNGGNKQPAIKKYFTEANVPYCRLHDCCGAYGGAYFVDIPNVFPNFDADENDPASYDFYYTDEYIKAIQDTGCETYYRLGVTIEWGSKKYSSVMPSDFGKWARICEHVIKHYNEGWADGFEFGIKYWEIWNEPENPGNEYGPCQWSGTFEEFYDLYKVTSKHLRSKFPDIKIGGFGSCGFYTVTRDRNPAGFETFVPFFENFLKEVKAENCPLDFFSWHIYTNDEKELLAHAKFVRETLDSYGFEKTESHLNEWNVNGEGTGFIEKHTEFGASFDAAVMMMLQNTDYVDKAMYYAFSYNSAYNGFMNQNDKSIIDVPWYSFVSFGKLYSLGKCVPAVTDSSLYALGATDGKNCAVMVSNYSDEAKETVLDMKGCLAGGKVTVKYINDDNAYTEKISFTSFENGEIKLDIPKYTVVFVAVEA